MEQNVDAIAALERVRLTVEAELTALRTGQAPTPGPVATVAPPPPSPPAPSWPPQSPATFLPPSTPTPPPAVAFPPPTAPAPPGPRPIPPHPQHAQPVAARAAGSGGLERVFRLGGISLVVLAAVFFVSTAISRGWIGPTAQLTLAALTSLGIIGQSFRFSTAQRAWRNTMAIGGSASLFVTGVIGHFGLDLLDINIAMAWLGGTALGFLLLARAHNSEVIATSGAPAALLGLLLFTASGDASAPVVLGLGVLWAVSVLAATLEQRWFGARAAGAATAATIIVLGALIDPSATTTAVGALIGMAAVIALVASQLREYTRAASEGALTLMSQVEARLSATTSPWVVFVASILIHEEASLFDVTESIGWIAIAVGFGVFVAATAAAAANRIHPTMSMLHQLAGLGTAALGLVAVLDGPALIAALLGQAVVSAALAYRTSSPEMTIGASVVGSIPTLWTLVTLARGVAGNTLTAGEIIVSGAVVATVAAVSFVVKDRPKLDSAWLVGWGGYLFWVTASLQAVPQTQMAISLAWAASALALIGTRRVVWGTQTVAQAKLVLNVALGTLLVTGAKLVFVDLVAVDVLWRAGLFLLIGGTFLRLAFVLPSILDVDAGATPADEDRPDPASPNPY